MRKEHCPCCEFDKDFKKMIKQHWEEIDDEDLETLTPIKEQLRTMLEKKYKFSERKAKHELDDFLEKISTAGKHAKHKAREMGMEQIEELKDAISEITENFLESFSEKGAVQKYWHKGEEKMIESVKSNPLHSLGIVAVAGFIIGTYITSKFK